MWPISARPAAEGAAGDVKVPLPPRLDLRDRRFQLGSVGSAGNPGPAAAAAARAPSATDAALQGTTSSGNSSGSGTPANSSGSSYDAPGADTAGALVAAFHAGVVGSASRALASPGLGLDHAGPTGSSSSHGPSLSARHHHPRQLQNQPQRQQLPPHQHQLAHPAASPSSSLIDQTHRQYQTRSAAATSSSSSSSTNADGSRYHHHQPLGPAAVAGKQRERKRTDEEAASSPASDRQSPPRKQARIDASAAAAAAASSSGPRQAPSSPSSSAKDRRLAKLRRRAAKEGMEPPVLSFYGAKPVPLPPRFAAVKRSLIAGHEPAVAASWGRLLAALSTEMAAIRAKSSSVERMMGAIDFADIGRPDRVAGFSALLKRFGVGVIRGVVPPADTERWVDETRRYLENKHDIKPPPPQDPTCFDFFWTPAQVRARAHPHVLRAMKFAMGLWDCESDDRMATRFPINYADRLRIHVNVHAAAAAAAAATPSPADPGAPAAKDVGSDSPAARNSVPSPTTTTTTKTANKNSSTLAAGADAGPSSAAAALGSPPPLKSETPVVEAAAAAAAASAAVAAAATSGSQPIIAQVDGGSLERWEPDGYGRSGTYDSIFRGDWESYDPWDPTGRISATSDLYNGAGACSIFRMFQGLVALTQVQPGMIRLLPSPKLVTAYFLLRPFFSPKTPPPPGRHEGPEWDAFLAADNWTLDEEQNTIIHGAVPGHAQRVTELWHPHLDLKRTLVTPPNLQAGDYIIWHCETAYTITSSVDSRPATPGAGGAGGAAAEGAEDAAAKMAAAVAAAADAPRHERFMVYAPACPLTQTNALYLARQRKAFQRGHPGPDFDTTGTGLGTEAPHVDRLGEKEIRDVGGVEALRAMGLAPWDAGTGPSRKRKATEPAPGDKMDVDSGGGAAAAGKRAADAGPGDAPIKMEVDESEDKPESSSASSSSASGPTPPALSPAEAELVRLANIILFPDKYEFYMATRHSTPDGGKG